MTAAQIAQEFAAVVQRAARVPALEAEVQDLRRIVDELVKKREAVGSAPRDGRRMLTMKEVETRTGLKRPTIYRYVAAGKFPKQIQVGAAAVRWCEADVNDWLDSRRSRGGQDDP